MYEVIVFFRSKPVEWSGKVRDEDVIARLVSPWRWLALLRGRAFLRECVPDRCGAFLLVDGKPESIDSTTEVLVQ